jgi:D-alanyl-D-alanine carboxypeptidase
MKLRCALLLPALLLLLVSPALSQTIQERIDAIFARPALAGNVWTGYAVSEDGDLVHYSHLPDTPRIPASNAKITTTSAAYELLGPDYAFESRVYANGTITGGVLNGDLNLVVEHDPTWATTYFSNARTPLNHIATRVKTVAGITAVTGVVRVYGASVYAHSSTGSLASTSQANHNASSAAAFRDALIANGVAVSGGSFGNTGFSPPGTLVYTHKSSDVGGYNLNLLLRPLNKISINPAADMISRHLGYKMNGKNPSFDTYAAGRAVIEAWMADNKPFDSTGFAQADGSGLSYNNRQTARMMVGLFRYMRENNPNFEASYAIACTDGTLGSRLCGTDTTGRVHGKTGSLNVTIALSGYVRNRHNNERVYFSFQHNNNNGIDQPATRQALDDAVRVLAGSDVPTFHLPGQPILYNVRPAGNPPRVVVQWTAGQDAQGHRIYRSMDGGPFVQVATTTTAPHVYLDTVPLNAICAYRVAAYNDDGEGPASSALIARAVESGPLVLLARGTGENDPTAATPLPTSMTALLDALGDEYGLEMAPVDRIESGSVDLTRYAAILWYFEHTAPETHLLTANQRTQLSAYLNGGGALMISGSKLATNMDPAFGGDAASGEFLHEVLKHEAYLPDAGVNFMNSAVTTIFEDISFSNFGGCNTAQFPLDRIMATSGGVRELVYQPTPGESAAAVSYKGDYRLVVFPAPLECLAPDERPGQYMERILQFLIPPPPGLGDTFAIH